MGNIHSKISFLREQIERNSFIVILQEVKPNTYELLKNTFQSIAQIEYSLTYRIPGKFDTDSRKLGIVIMVSNDMILKNASVLNRALLPDRTLLVDVCHNNTELRILGLHSITGCHHMKAKEIQYFSFAEAVETYSPDIIGIDANEPQIDHYDISKMKFFDNYQKGNGCKTFFESVQENALVDAFVHNYNFCNYVEGEHLATSHVIKRGKKKVRYDFLFVNLQKIKNFRCIYEYDKAIAAGSDHAAVILSEQ